MAAGSPPGKLCPALACSLGVLAVWSLFLLTAFGFVGASLLGVFRTQIKTPLKTPLYVTQRQLTHERIGAALMHLRKTMVLTHQLGSCLKVPDVKSEHGYYVRHFFPKCTWARPDGPRSCRVRTLLSEKGWQYWIEGEEGEVSLDRLRSCRTIELANPDLRDFDSRYNTTAFLVKNLKVRNEDSLDCTGIDAVFQYRYGDIANVERHLVSKQVHYRYVQELVSSGKVSLTSLLIVTDPTGKQHIASKFPGARFFTNNDPAALKQCADKTTTFIGGGSTYAYVCFQMLKPKIVYTTNVTAVLRVRYPPNITVDLM